MPDGDPAVHAAFRMAIAGRLERLAMAHTCIDRLLGCTWAFAADPGVPVCARIGAGALYLLADNQRGRFGLVDMGTVSRCIQLAGYRGHLRQRHDDSRGGMAGP